MMWILDYWRNWGRFLTVPAPTPHAPITKSTLKTAEPKMVPTPMSLWAMKTPAIESRNFLPNLHPNSVSSGKGQENSLQKAVRKFCKEVILVKKRLLGEIPYASRRGGFFWHLLGHAIFPPKTKKDSVTDEKLWRTKRMSTEPLNGSFRCYANEPSVKRGIWALN